MKRLLVLLALSGVVMVSACEDPRPAEPEVADAMMEPVAPSIDAAAAPVAEPSAPPPLESSTLPSEKKTSEQSVQPESETLFY